MSPYRPHTNIAGEFSTRNGTIDFHLRVISYLNESSVVLDLGAGRGGWYELEKNQLIRRVRDLRQYCKVVIGVDIDTAVLENPTTTENRLMNGSRIPVDDESIDAIICDYVIEHVDDPVSFMSEIDRVLKPGGVFCARTPHAFSYVALFARSIPNTQHARFLSGAQPDRQAEDVFPTKYKMNTMRAVRRLKPTWISKSHVYKTDPSYFFGSKTTYRLLSLLHHVAPKWFIGNLMVFLEKPS